MYLHDSLVTVRIGALRVIVLGPGELGTEGDLREIGSLTEIGKCLRENQELPIPFRLAVLRV